MRYEVGVNAHPPNGVTPEDVKGLSYVRFPVWQDNGYDYRPFIEGTLAQGMYVEVVCDRRFFPTNEWTRWLRVFKKKYPMVDWLQILNEWDADPSIPSESWPRTNAQVDAMMLTARKVMGDSCFITLGDTISGDGPRRLSMLKNLNAVNAIGFAPYAARPSMNLPYVGFGTANIWDVYQTHKDAIAAYPHLQIECGEWGYKQSEVPDEHVRAHTTSEMLLAQARLGVARGALYCLTETQSPEFYIQGLESEAALFGAGAVIELPDPTSVHAPIVMNTLGEDIGGNLVQYASVYGVPLRLALACAIAESGLNPYAERWGLETARARSYINSGDYGSLQAVINRVWADVSFGYGQQIVRYHYEGNQSRSVENCLAVRNAVFADPLGSLENMCMRLAADLAIASAGDLSPIDGDVQLGALVIYNSGSLHSASDPWWSEWAGNVSNYRLAFRLADELIGPFQG